MVVLSAYAKIFTRLFFVLSAIFVSLIAAEGVARWKLPEYEQRFLHFQDAGAWKHFTWSSLLGWRGRPGFCGHFARPEFFHEVCQNSVGFRDEDHSLEKKDNTFRVLVLGDSFVYGVGVKQEEVFSKVISQENSSLEIINAGVSGYSTDLEYLYLREEGILYRPDLVVTVFYLNDVWENDLKTFEDGKWQKPFFEWDGSQLTLTNVPVPNDLEKFISSTSNEEKKVLEDIHPFLSFFLAHSVLANVVVDRLQVFPPASDMLQKLGVLYPFTLSSFDSYFDPNRIEELRPQWERTGAIFGSMKSLLDSNNIPLEVLYIPVRQQLEPDFQQSSLSKGYEVELPQKTLAHLLSQYNVSFTDLSSTFMADRSQGSSLYFRQDSHLNASGHIVLAHAIEEIIKKYVPPTNP